MTQPLLSLILSADYVSGGQGAEGGTRVSLVLGFSFFPGWGRVEIGASGLYCGEAAQTPPLTEAPPRFAGNPWLCRRFSVMSIRFTEHDWGDWGSCQQAPTR